MRSGIHHARGQRSIAEPIVVAVELSGGKTGYGEAQPRAYVTGETVESVTAAVREVYLPALLEFHPRSFPDALEAAEALPWHDAFERLIPAARAAVELALLDAILRFYKRRLDDVAGWMGIPGSGSPGSIGKIRFSGMLAAPDTARTIRQLRYLYCAGLRDFKLKVGYEGDLERARRVMACLDRWRRWGAATLRVDANGSWSKDQAIEWLGYAASGISVIEQPLPKGSEQDLPILCDLFEKPIMHDESLVTIDDARRLIEMKVADAFNVRISKCGGLLASLRLAELARRSDVRLQLGCMIGETSILSAAGVRFLEVCPGVEWAEGCFGSYFLKKDVIARGLRFGYGGRPPRTGEVGLGIEVSPQRLAELMDAEPEVLNL